MIDVGCFDGGGSFATSPKLGTGWRPVAPGRIKTAMHYSKKQFGYSLLNELSKGVNVRRIASWAFGIQFEYGNNFEKGLDEIVMKVIMMEEGREFELTEAKLRELAHECINSSG